jgi:hypothetical protein
MEGDNVGCTNPLSVVVGGCTNPLSCRLSVVPNGKHNKKSFLFLLGLKGVERTREMLSERMS